MLPAYFTLELHPNPGILYIGVFEMISWLLMRIELYDEWAIMENMDTRIQNLINQASKESKGISILSTADQLESFYNSNIGRYKQWRAIASIEDWLPVNPEFLQEFRKKLSGASVDTRVIFKASGLKYEVASLPHREVKVVPDTYAFKSSVDILDDKILIMNPHQTVLGLVIESPILVDVFIDMFDMLWNMLPEKK